MPQIRAERRFRTSHDSPAGSGQPRQIDQVCAHRFPGAGASSERIASVASHKGERSVEPPAALSEEELREVALRRRGPIRRVASRGSQSTRQSSHGGVVGPAPTAWRCAGRGTSLEEVAFLGGEGADHGLVAGGGLCKRKLPQALSFL